jgi:Ca2+-binding RTX toxin-like protein
MPLITGTAGDDILDGGASDDTLDGFAGNDLLNGRGGRDRLEGGDGDDIYVVDSSDDLVVELENAGADTIYTEVDFRLADTQFVETVSARVWSGVTNLQLFGNRFANGLYGNDGANFIDGGAGSDVMVGFSGDDVYVVDSISDRVIELDSEGYDIIYTESDYTLAPGSYVEHLSARDWRSTTDLQLIGNDFGNLIEGNDGANFIDGGRGADVMAGFGGNDIYVVDHIDDQVFEVDGGGSDIIYAEVSYRLDNNSRVETLSTRDWFGTEAINLYGNAERNILFGNAGSNILDGGLGRDVMVGFGGDDFYYITQPDDQIIEGVDEGIDTVIIGQNGFGFSLLNLANVENVWADLTIERFTGVSTSGNALDNSFRGSNLDDSFNGVDGDDWMDGLLGADNLTGGNGADVFAFTTSLGNGNVDRVGDFVHGTDRIALNASIFDGLASVTADNFVAGSAALDAQDRIIFNPETGELFFDIDGNGTQAAVLFASIENVAHVRPDLNWSDFFILPATTPEQLRPWDDLPHISPGIDGPAPWAGPVEGVIDQLHATKGEFFLDYPSLPLTTNAWDL